MRRARVWRARLRYRLRQRLRCHARCDASRRPGSTAGQTGHFLAGLAAQPHGRPLADKQFSGDGRHNFVLADLHCGLDSGARRCCLVCHSVTACHSLSHQSDLSVCPHKPVQASFLRNSGLFDGADPSQSQLWFAHRKQNLLTERSTPQNSRKPSQ